MCGICGIATTHGQIDVERLRRLSQTLYHRGPDSEGMHVDAQVGADAGVLLADTTDAARADAPSDDATSGGGHAAVVLDAAVAIDASMPAARDASMPRMRDAAGPTASDAAVATIAIDAPVAPPIDAAPEAPTTGTLIIKSDRWCDASVDGQPRGQVASASAPLTLEIAAGVHEVECKQSTIDGGNWKRTVTVVGGKTATASGTLAQVVDVRLDVDAAIDGIAHRAGEVVKLARGRYEVQIGSAKKYVSFSVACHLGADLECRR